MAQRILNSGTALAHSNQTALATPDADLARGRSEASRRSPRRRGDVSTNQLKDTGSPRLPSKGRGALGAPRAFLFDEAGSSRRVVHVDQRELRPARDRRDSMGTRTYAAMCSWSLAGLSGSLVVDLSLRGTGAIAVYR